MADREKVISNLQGVYEYLRHFENTAKMGEWVSDALALLKEQKETIERQERHLATMYANQIMNEDRPEIVRCKNCKHGTDPILPYRKGCVWCERVNRHNSEDWFCADGERRDDDG